MSRPPRYRDVRIPSRTRSYVTLGPDAAPFTEEMVRRYGLAPGSRLCIEEMDHQLVVHRPVTHLARVYVEPTTECPLACRTCMRRAWGEPGGRMDAGVFGRIMDGLRALPSVPTVFFGGIGEPLCHPEILSMIRAARSLGARTELITNGLALDEQTVEALVELRLDALWVSLDGASEECYDAVRTSADGEESTGSLPRVVQNLQRLRAVKYRLDSALPALGIAFVSMRRNHAELGRVMELGLRAGATQFSISSVQPHTEEMRGEVLHEKTLGQSTGTLSRLDLARLDVARMDRGDDWGPAIASVLAENGLRFSDGRATTRLDDNCPFVENGSASIRWDGEVSPCLPLLHSHVAWLGDRKRDIRQFSFGSLRERSLAEIWSDPGYVRFRERLQEFDFPPCTRCNGCEAADSNVEDCYGKPAPTCGACAWAQGFIVCP